VIIGTHAILFSDQAEADRAFLRDKIGLRSVEAGGGWLIFALPPAEVAVHPGDGPGCALFLMSNDLDAEMSDLGSKGVEMTPVSLERWGRVTYLTLPGGGALGLYEPSHPIAIQRS
jgi:hypothetical protein